jgi:hypothetical protein
VLLITTLPAGRWPAEAILRVYRVRWQVELVFKRLKSGLTRGVLRGQTRASLEASILALLIAWVLQTSEAAHLRARLRTLAQDDGWVQRSWALTTLSVDVVRQHVRGGWGSQRVHACLWRLQPFLTSRVRQDRTHQETTVRTKNQRETLERMRNRLHAGAGSGRARRTSPPHFFVPDHQKAGRARSYPAPKSNPRAAAPVSELR